VITANLRHGEAIEGRVLSGGKPVAAELRIEGLPSAHTRWDGSFVVRLSSAADPAGGAYAVRAVSRGLHAASEIAQVTLAPGERHKRVDLALAPTGEITGTVVDGESDAPLESMIVSCEPRQGGERRISATGRTGAFRCPLLVREGPYALEVFAPGSGQPLAPARGRFPAVVLPSARARADRVVLAVQLERTQLAGRVVDDTERPVAEARVVATQPRGRAGEDDGSARDLTVSSAPAAVTGADGSFRLDVLAGGAWELRATTAAGATGALPAVTGPRSGVVVRLRAPGAIAGELAGFTRPPRVSIRPLADDAGGAAGTSAGDGGEASAAAAPPLEPEVRRGRFSARALPPGRYLVRADAAAEAAFARVEVAAGRTAAVVLTSGGWGALRGRVLDRSKGAAMAGVWCEAGPSPPERPPAREPGPGAVTDRAGRFVLDRVPAGDLEVRCWADEVAETTARVRVRRDAVTTVELRAAPAPAAPTAPPAPRR
jgi:hypothetical protein